MAGYAATARLAPDAARLGRPSRLESAPAARRGSEPPARPARHDAPVPVSAPPDAETGHAWFEEIRSVRAPSPAALRDRIDRLREVWTQATFYLFSPDSWR
jgi:hypothetical protein